MERLAQSFGFPSFSGIFSSEEAEAAAAAYSPVASPARHSLHADLPRVVGHSLGEYAALHVAGVLSVLDTIYLVGKRAQLVAETCTAHTRAMLAVA